MQSVCQSGKKVDKCLLFALNGALFKKQDLHIGAIVELQFPFSTAIAKLQGCKMIFPSAIIWADLEERVTGYKVTRLSLNKGSISLNPLLQEGFFGDLSPEAVMIHLLAE